MAINKRDRSEIWVANIQKSPYYHLITESKLFLEDCLSSMKRALHGWKSGKKKHVLLLFTKNSKFVLSLIKCICKTAPSWIPLFQDNFKTLMTITALHCMQKLSQLSWKYRNIFSWIKKVIKKGFFPATIQQTTPKQYRDCWDGKKTDSEWCQLSGRGISGNNEWPLPGWRL